MSELITRILVHKVRYIRIIYWLLFAAMIGLTLRALHVISQTDDITFILNYMINFSVDITGMFAILVIFGNSPIEKMTLNRGQVIFHCLLVCNFMGLFLDIFAWMVQGVPDFVSRNMWINYGYYMMGVLIMALFWEYLVFSIKSDLSDRVRIVVHTIIYSITVFRIIVLTTNFWTGLIFTVDAEGMYSRTPGTYYIEGICSLIGPIIMTVILVVYKIDMRKKLTLLSYIFFPIIAQSITVLNFGISLSFVGTVLALIMVFGNIYLQQQNELRENKRIIADTKSKLMMSQLRPHFLFNSLATIQGMDGNDEDTREAIADFAQYLRDNLDNINHNTCVTLDHELQHVEAYVRLCNLRFGDRIKVEYDISFRDFVLPVLSISSLVENSIQHGILPGEGTGKVLISTYEDANNCYVEVVDNGIGFNPRKLTLVENSKSHMGLSNIMYRVEVLCMGKMKVLSKIGKGTKVKIVIPKLM